ncbi:MAG: hypothetical protein KDA32_04710 [Phycisphaerales bacterium]|nr:hypothetical protein [Phycisphaerales bacterium]
MAGRPRKRAEQVTELLTRTVAVSQDLYAITPEWALVSRKPGDSTAFRWVTSNSCLFQAVRELQELTSILRGRAGLDTVDYRMLIERPGAAPSLTEQHTPPQLPAIS